MERRSFLEKMAAVGVVNRSRNLDQYQFQASEWSTSLLWSNILDTPGIDIIESCTVGYNNQLYFVGWNEVEVSEEDQELIGWIIQTDYEGNINWQNTFGGSELERVWDVVHSDTGGVTVVGSTQSIGPGFRAVWQFGITDEGEKNWEEVHGYEENEAGYSIAKARDGGYVIGGRTRTLGNDKSDTWVFKTNRRGEIQWERVFTFAEESHSDATHIVRTRDGGFLILVDESFLNTNENQIQFIKIDQSGDDKWIKTYNPKRRTNPNDAIVTDQGIIVLASTETGADSQTGNILLNLDENGNIQSENELPPPGLEAIEQAPFGFVSIGDQNRIIAHDVEGEIFFQTKFDKENGRTNPQIHDVVRDVNGNYVFCGNTGVVISDENDDGEEEIIDWSNGIIGRFHFSFPDEGSQTDQTSTPTAEPKPTDTQGSPTSPESMLGPVTTYYAFLGLVTATGLSIGGAAWHYWVRDRND